MTPTIPPIVFTLPGLDRAAQHRDNAEWLAAAMTEPKARLYLFAGDVPLMNTASPRDPLWTFAGAAPFGEGFETIFLGLDDHAPRFARRLPALVKENEAVLFDGQPAEALGLLPLDLRAIVLKAAVDEAHLQPLATAKALLYWHQRHQFCAHCGHKSEAAKAGWQRDCPACKAQHFPRTDPVVIMLIERGDACLMGRSPHFAPKVYSSLAGFMEPGETVEDAVRREVMEESGIRVGRVTQLANQPWPFPASLMIACCGEALSEAIVRDGELEDCRWFSRVEVRTMLDGTHPEGLICPPSIGVSNFLIRSFAAAG